MNIQGPINSLLMSIFTILAICRSVNAQSVAEMDKARMDAAVKFAETVLKYGRDTYGEKHTPLFTDVLDVDTMKAPEKIYINRLSRPGPRQYQPWQPLVSSNLSFQGNLMRFLAGLSNLTGNSEYKEAYKENIRYYFEHYQTKAGVLSMGHHRFIDLKADNYDGDDWPAGDRGHEMKGDFPYYDLFWETDPEATRRMLTGHWNCHIKNWDNMEFTRHGRWNKGLDAGVWDRPMGKPIKGIVKGDLTFFGSGSDIIWAGGKLSQLDGGDKRPLNWTKRLLARYIDSTHPETGIPPCHHTSARDFAREMGFPNESWPEYALLTPMFSNDVFGAGATMLMRLGEAIGEEGDYFRKSVRAYLKAYATHAYNPEDNTLRAILYDGTDLSEFMIKNMDAYGAPKDGAWHPWKAHSDYMLSYALCYRQSKDNEIWGTLRSICRGNDLGDIGKTGEKAPKLNLETSQSAPEAIFALIEVFRATGNRAFLDLARVIGNNSMKQRFNAEKGLFVKSKLHKNAILNVSEPLAFLTLEAAINDKFDSVPTYDGSGVNPSSNAVLRSTKVLPYHPSASHCWYSDTVQAMCDELIPFNSSDTSIPRMSWARPSYSGGGRHRESVTATFPDILYGPVTITEPVDSADSNNRLSGMIIDSPFSYTFTEGNLQMSHDFTITVLQGDHKWQTGNWTPSKTLDYILDVSAAGRFTFADIIYEYDQPTGGPAGLVKNGDGTAVVTGDYGPKYSPEPRKNRAYHRNTVVNAGVLLVNNSTGSGISPQSAVEVNDGGTLGGNGAIGNGGTSAIVNAYAGGTIAPGSGVGTLTIRDGLTLHDGPKLAFELGTASDLLKVTGGILTVSGRRGVSVLIADSGGLAVGNTYDLIDWTGAKLSAVDVGDFVSGSDGTYVGKFNISDNFLKITITGLAKGRTTNPLKTAKSKIAKTERLAANTWINPNGGNWKDNANWYGGMVPNGPRKEWVQYSFKNPRKVSSVDVYWFDDKYRNQVPESWRVLYRQAGKWMRVEDASEYGVLTDQFNAVRFKEVKTGALRLEVQLKPSRFGGILEWRVNPPTTKTGFP